MSNCTVPQCNKRHYAKGLCKMHYARVSKYGYTTANFAKKHEGKCSIEECENPAKLLGWCRMHYKRNYKYGDPTFKKKAQNGEGTIRSDGYKQLRINGKIVFEHILIAEQALGKKLPPGAVVHHMNENRSDNFTPFNLIICPDQTYHFLLHKRKEMFMRRVRADTEKRNE